MLARAGPGRPEPLTEAERAKGQIDCPGAQHRTCLQPGNRQGWRRAGSRRRRRLDGPRPSHKQELEGDAYAIA